MKKLCFFIILFLNITTLYAQPLGPAYVVSFTDKNNSPYSLDNPSAFLTPAAIDRRIRQEIPIQENDLPVNANYLVAITNAGAQIAAVSRWFNTVAVWINDPAVVGFIEDLQFVSSVISMDATPISPVNMQPSQKLENEDDFIPIEPGFRYPANTNDYYDYGNAYNQINMISGISLHNQGFRGEGMVIAVLDAGFRNVNIITAFDHLRDENRILGTRDFVQPGNNVYHNAINSHGTNVLSIMAAYLPGQMVGSAPKASYWLIRTEDAVAEYLMEEYFWVAGAEFADSIGAWVINSSLGYTVYDNPYQNHTYADMDGNTTPITRGADLAASKGILVVNSAGNSGNTAWTYIGAPADGDSVLAIGAVNAAGNYASFSSRGPSYDGRVKPDVSAQGSGTSLVNSSGVVTTGSGTSYSSPLMAGMAACLWQSNRNVTNMQVAQAIKQSGTLYNNPTVFLGYGIPDFEQAGWLLPWQVKLQAKVFLEGPYNQAIDIMQTDLQQAGMIPFQQPYTIPPWNYPGSESVTGIPADIVDWILVELREATSPVNSLTAQALSGWPQALFLRSDGMVVDLDGVSLPSFNMPQTSQNLYMLVYHRNHLSILSNTGVNLTEHTYYFDFSDAIDKVFGGETGYKQISTSMSRFGLVGGDGDANGQIQNQDKNNIWNPQSGASGYLPGDFDMNGQVQNQDKNNIWNTNTGKGSAVRK